MAETRCWGGTVLGAEVAGAVVVTAVFTADVPAVVTSDVPADVPAVVTAVGDGIKLKKNVAYLYFFKKKITIEN
ncbi:hypothetical protein AYI68_g7488 [Smittium mucronatum]|uniref:Uncharacterized protein n=1 Tax=Smittium mucronatum TaxID=133383 RepID=A0A1R0GNJ1_9FUNG|nr:hypothetical protein AYI68_g7488 [Smittium mucronatum]